MSQDKNKDEFPWGDLTRLVNNTIDPKLKAARVHTDADIDAMREKHNSDMDALNSTLNDIIKDFGEYMSLAEQMSDLIEMHHRDHLAHEERLDALDLKTADIERDYLNKITQLEKNFNSQISSINNSVTNINTKIKVDPDGGIINSTGGLAVDFSKMPTDKMEALLKTIRVPIFLERHKNFYVDGSIGNDSTNIEGIGETPEKPFKTIQACVNYISTNYNINSRAVYIMVNDGTYSRFTLGDYTRTTGLIALRPYTNKEKNFGVIIADKNSILCYCTAGTWYIYGFTFKGTY